MNVLSFFYLKFASDIDNVGGEWKINACFAVIYMNWYICQTSINKPARWTTNIPVAESLSNINPSGANPAYVRDLKFVNTVAADPLAPDGASPSADTMLNITLDVAFLNFCGFWHCRKPTG